MKQKNYSLNIHWDKRYPKAGTIDLCPIQLAVNLITHKVQFKISLKLYSTKDDWEKAMQGKGRSAEVRELRSQINDYLTKAETILERLPDPSRETFQRLFKSETDLFASHKTDVSLVWDAYIIELEKEERIKTALNLKWALRSFRKYSKDLFFEDINAAFLKGYVAWMAKEGKSQTTSQIYIRNLRTIFNKAIKEGYISDKHYPFRHFSIGGSAKSKGVLYAAQIRMIYEYKGNLMTENRARDMFMACYLANGLNFKDLALLKWSNLNGDIISFVREKTKRTNKVSGKEIKIYVLPELRKIIETWGSPNKGPNDYIFDIVDDTMSAKVQHNRIRQFQRRVNKRLVEIGEHLGIKIPLNTNLARHSFATALKIADVPVSQVSELMGHSSIVTTSHYLKSLPDIKLKAISETLMKF